MIFAGLVAAILIGRVLAMVFRAIENATIRRWGRQR